MSKNIWTKDMESNLVKLIDSGIGFNKISQKMGITESSAKHKIRRLKQHQNDEKYHHPKEKIEQIKRHLKGNSHFILETNCGYGNLTKIYQHYGEVLALDIDKEKVLSVEKMCMEDVFTDACDSILETHFFVYKKLKFTVIDLDPYGMPSRFFPHIFMLIDSGTMFITLPKLGVQKLNKIMAKHLECFYGIDQSNRKEYEQIFIKKIIDFGMQNYREVKILEILSVGSVFRIVASVNKKSSLDLVGLKISKNIPMIKKHGEETLFDMPIT